MPFQKLAFSILVLLSLSGPIKSQISGNFMFDGINRTWVVYLPQNYQSGDSFPLLIALHGLTQNGQSMMTFTGFNAIADTGNFIVVYPDGVNNSWNVGFVGGSTADDVGFLSALIDTLHQDYTINLNRVYATGFSNGGFLSYRLACELGDRIAAIAPVAGTMTTDSYTACAPSRNMPVLHIHGTNDFVVSYNGGFGNKSVDQVLGLWNNYNNCPANAVVIDLPDLVAEGSTVKQFTWSPCDESTEVKLLKVINGGHTWPGSVGVTGAGNTNRDISASGEIWKFVSRFTLDIYANVNNKPSEKMLVVPNPVQAQNIVITFPENYHFTGFCIYTLQGVNVLSQAIAGNTFQQVVDISGLKSGIYFIKASGAGKQIVTKLMVL